MSDETIIILFIILGSIAAFFALRFVSLWYFKITDRYFIQKEILESLHRIEKIIKEKNQKKQN